MSRILVVGSVAYDTVETSAGRSTRQLGGSATYFSVASSYLADVAVVAVVGEDFASEDRAMLRAHGVETSGLEQAAGDTFRWSGSYRDDPNTAVTLETRLNVFAGFTPRLRDSHRSAPYLFLANIDPELQSSVLDQMAARPKLVACDTMNLWIDSSRPALVSLMRSVDTVLINEAEARQLTGRRGIAAAAEALLEMGPASAVIKRGEHGAVVFHRDFTFAVPAYPLVSVVDPTGAGDSFAGGFMGYLAAVDEAGPEALRCAAVVGSVMASFAVEGFGLGRLKSLSAADINERFGAFVELTRFRPPGEGQGLPLAAR